MLSNGQESFIVIDAEATVRTALKVECQTFVDVYVDYFSSRSAKSHVTAHRCESLLDHPKASLILSLVL